MTAGQLVDRPANSPNIAASWASVSKINAPKSCEISTSSETRNPEHRAQSSSPVNSRRLRTFPTPHLPRPCQPARFSPAPEFSGIRTFHRSSVSAGTRPRTPVMPFHAILRIMKKKHKVLMTAGKLANYKYWPKNPRRGEKGDSFKSALGK